MKKIVAYFCLVVTGYGIMTFTWGIVVGEVLLAIVPLICLIVTGTATIKLWEK